MVSRDNLYSLNNDFKKLKLEIFGNTDIVIHSVDIRKWRDAFIVLKDEALRMKFFNGIERILSQNDAYIIVSCTILKEQLNKFCVRGEEEDVYGLSLSYLIERSIFCVDNLTYSNPDITIIVERRGKKEDAKLLNYYNGLRNRGTKWITPERLRSSPAVFYPVAQILQKDSRPVRAPVRSGTQYPSYRTVELSVLTFASLKTFLICPHR